VGASLGQTGLTARSRSRCTRLNMTSVLRPCSPTSASFGCASGETEAIADWQGDTTRSRDDHIVGRHYPDRTTITARWQREAAGCCLSRSVYS